MDHNSCSCAALSILCICNCYADMLLLLLAAADDGDNDNECDKRVTTDGWMLYCDRSQHTAVEFNCNTEGKRVALLTHRRFNKSANSNLGREPRRGTVAHLRRKVPIGYSGAPEIRPQKYPSPWTNPHTCLIPVRPMMPNDYDIRIRSAVFQQCNGQTGRPTDRRTD